MVSHEEIERSGTWHFDFLKLQQIGIKIDPKNPVIPVIVQNAKTNEVLILAYTNQEALNYSLEHGVATFWSTSRNELWIKGKTSGDILKIIEIRVNCEQNSLLYLVEPFKGGACHVKDKHGESLPTCYYRKLNYDKNTKSIKLETLSPFTI